MFADKILCHEAYAALPFHVFELCASYATSTRKFLRAWRRAPYLLQGDKCSFETWWQDRPLPNVAENAGQLVVDGIRAPLRARLLRHLLAQCEEEGIATYRVQMAGEVRSVRVQVQDKEKQKAMYGVLDAAAARGLLDVLEQLYHTHGLRADTLAEAMWPSGQLNRVGARGPLYHAANSGHLHCVQYLRTTYGMDHSWISKLYYAPLIAAATYNNVPMLREFRLGFNLQMCTEEACRNRHSYLTAACLRCDGFYRVLQVAVLYQHVHVLEELGEKGYQVPARIARAYDNDLLRRCLLQGYDHSMLALLQHFHLTTNDALEALHTIPGTLNASNFVSRIYFWQFQLLVHYRRPSSKSCWSDITCSDTLS